MGFKENRQARKEAKAARKAERWAPFVEKREAAIESAGDRIGKLGQSYPFYTVIVLVMAVVGFFWTQVMEVVALVGSIAMWQHWSSEVKNGNDEPLILLWRIVSGVSFPISLAGVGYFVYCVVTGQVV